MGSRSRCSSAVEQLFRKQQVKGSNPFTGSPKTRSRTRNQATDWLPLRVAHAACPATMLQCARRPGGLRLQRLAFGMLRPVRSELLPRLTGKRTGNRQPLPLPLATEREAAASLPLGRRPLRALHPCGKQRSWWLATTSDRLLVRLPRVTALDRLGTPGSMDERPRARRARVPAPTRREVRRHDAERACAPAHVMAPPVAKTWLPRMPVVASVSGPGCGPNACTVSRGAGCTSCLRCPCRGTRSCRRPDAR